MRTSILVGGILAAALSSTLAAATDIGDGSISTFVSWARLNSSNPGGSTTSQFGYFSRGTIAVKGQAIFSGPLVQADGSVLGNEVVNLTYQPGRWEPGKLKQEYLSTSNLVFSRSYKYRDATGKIINGTGTATGPGLQNGIIPKLEKVEVVGDGVSLLATFGYLGNFNAGITYPISSKINKLNIGASGQITTGAKPEIFAPGLKTGVFQVKFNFKRKVTWTVDNKVVEASFADVGVAVPG